MALSINLENVVNQVEYMVRDIRNDLSSSNSNVSVKANEIKRDPGSDYQLISNALKQEKM